MKCTKKTKQMAAVMLCCHRGSTAFLVASSPRSSSFSALASRTMSTAAAAANPLSEPSRRQAEEQHMHGLRTVNSVPDNVHGRSASAVRSASGGLSDADVALKKLMAEDFGANVQVDPKRVAVLFDFDGTVGDTETPAMEVAYWEVAPYYPAATTRGELQDMSEFIRNNVGKAFEFVLEACEEERKAAGLPDIAAVRAEAGENPEVMKIVDENRAKFGLKPLGELRAVGALKDILAQQKEEATDALSVVARPTEGMVDTLKELKTRNIPFAIATTSPKPRVPVSVHSCGLDDYFPPDKIHSGESDFDPPRFKPDPSVYLKAAQFEGALPSLCIAVEDSPSGVGSADAADMGLIVGYVGASHVTDAGKKEHAETLRQRGARVVLNNMKDLIPLVDCFTECMAKGVDYSAPIAEVIETLDKDAVWE